jgi:hypothetical protein
MSQRQASQTRGLALKGKGRSRRAGSDSSDSDGSDDAFSARATADEDVPVAVDRAADDEVQPLDRGEQLIRDRHRARKKEQKRLAAIVARQQQMVSSKRSLRDGMSPTPQPHDVDTDLESVTEAGDVAARPIHSRRTTVESEYGASSVPPSPMDFHPTLPSSEAPARPPAWLAAGHQSHRRVSYVPSVRDRSDADTSTRIDPPSSTSDGHDSEEERQLARGGPLGEEEDSEEEDNNDDVECALPYLSRTSLIH